MLGRVTATQRFALFAINPLGAIVGGLLATVVGVQLTLLTAAAGAALTAVWLGLSRLRRLRQMPGHEVAAQEMALRTA